MGTAGDNRGREGQPSPRPEGRRRADAERNFAAIVDAALVAFSERPDATMADVALAAGVGRVTLYAHFPSREALLEAAVHRAVADLDAALGHDVTDDLPARDALRAVIRSSWQAIDRAGRLSIAAQRTLAPERLRQMHGAVLDRLDGLVERGRADGAFRTDLPAPWMVTTIYSLFHAAAEDVGSGRLDAADAAPVLEATLLAALTAPSPPARAGRHQQPRR
jgi:AcrR family transcriptional regulator